LPPCTTSPPADAPFRTKSRALAEADQQALPVHLELSPREFEIFLLLAEGDSVEQIAARHWLSAKTVANYQTAIRQKTALATSLEMYRYAEAHGLLRRSPASSTSSTS
jgi:DNA-binding CsgD family transcriptional regulator